MSDLYRIDLDTPDVGDSNFDETRDKYLAALTAWGVLVPVIVDYEAAAAAGQNRRHVEAVQYHMTNFDHEPFVPAWEDVLDEAKVSLVAEARADVDTALGEEER